MEQNLSDFENNPLLFNECKIKEVLIHKLSNNPSRIGFKKNFIESI